MSCLFIPSGSNINSKDFLSNEIDFSPIKMLLTL